MAMPPSRKLRFPNPFKNLMNPTNVYNAQRPLLKLTLLSGIVPYKITNDGNSRLQISVFGFTILILHLSLFGFCYVRTITAHESIVSYFFKTEISVLGDTLQLCIGLIGIFSVFLYSLVQRHKFVLWFHLMSRIDEQLKEIGIETDYKSTIKFIFLVLFVKFIFFNTYLIGSWILFKIAGVSPNYACWIVFFMPHIFISIIVVLFICLVKQMKHRFFMLNKVSFLTCWNHSNYQLREHSIKIIKLKFHQSFPGFFSCRQSSTKIIFSKYFPIKIVLERLRHGYEWFQHEQLFPSGILKRTFFLQIDSEEFMSAKQAEFWDTMQSCSPLRYLQLLFATPEEHKWNCNSNFNYSRWIMRRLCSRRRIFQRSDADNCGNCVSYNCFQHVTISLVPHSGMEMNSFTLSYSYYILGAIFGNANTGKYFNTLEFITFFSYQIAVHFLSVMAIVYVSSAVSKESEKTSTCVHKLLNMTKNEGLKVQLTQLSMQLLHRKVKFTACNLFTLDTSLIFTVSL